LKSTLSTSKIILLQFDAACISNDEIHGAWGRGDVEEKDVRFMQGIRRRCRWDGVERR
jgi:hypothetical protein